MTYKRLKRIPIKIKRVHDPWKKKVIQLQDFFFARNSSIEDIEKKFGISPFKSGKRFVMKIGIVKYREEDIERMLSVFNDAANPFSGNRKYRKDIV